MPRKPRIISACNVCRRRRVRCDKTRPICIVCVRHKCENECSYKKLPAWANDKNAEEVGKNDLNACIANIENMVNIDVLTVEEKISLVSQIQKRIDILESALQPKDETIDFTPLFIRVEPEFNSITNVTPLSYLGTTFRDGVFLKAREFLKLSENSVSDHQYELLNIRHLSGLKGINSNINSINNFTNFNNTNSINNFSNKVDNNNVNDSNHNSVSNSTEKKFRIQIFDIISMVKHNGLKKMDKISFEKSLSHIPLPTGLAILKGKIFQILLTELICDYQV